MMKAKRKNTKHSQQKAGKSHQTCVCDMEWRTNSEGEEWFDCVCTPKEENEHRENK